MGRGKGFPPEARDWVATQDWEELKDEFFHTFSASGRFRYRTLHEFAREKWPAGQKREIRWLVAATGELPRSGIEWKGDWIEERILARSKYSNHLKTLRDKVAVELDLFQTGRVLAESYYPFQQKVFEVWKEVENYVGGKVLLEIPECEPQERRIAEAENVHRLNFYMETLERIIDMKMKLDNQFLRSLGWDRPQVLAVFQNLREQYRKEHGIGTRAEDTGLESMLKELAKDQIAKAEMYALPLPDEIENVAKHMRLIQPSDDVEGKEDHEMD